MKTRKADRHVWQIELETVAPVEYRSLACRLSDETGLPMTVFSTTDPDMRWTVCEFTRGQAFAPGPVNPPYTYLPLVTFLPNCYFVGHPNLRSAS